MKEILTIILFININYNLECLINLLPWNFQKKGFDKNIVDEAKDICRQINEQNNKSTLKSLDRKKKLKEDYLINLTKKILTIKNQNLIN